MKVVIKGEFTTGDEYWDVAHNKQEFIARMKSIAENEACRFPDFVQARGKVPGYVQDYIDRCDPDFKVIICK